MKNRTLNLFEYALTRIGLNYLANLNTKEIHFLDNRKENCRIDMMQTHHRLFIPKWVMLLLLKKGFNGCYHCNRKYDKRYAKKNAQ